MADFKTLLLCELLDCGTSDVDILEDIEYDVSDLVEYCDMNFEKVTLEGLVICAFSFGLRDFRKSIDKRIKVLESAESLTKAEKKELKSLKQLDPENDSEWYFNYLDTSIWFNENNELYKKYCQEELDEFYENTGYEIKYWE